MATLFIYTMSAQNQADMFISDKNGDISLQEMKDLLLRRSSPNNNGLISGEGFSNASIITYSGINFIESYCTSEGSLGYFYEALVDQGVVTSRKVQHSYFSKSKIIITENAHVIIKFDWAAEEKARIKVKEMIESLGTELEAFKITDTLIRFLQKHYHWTAAKIDRIEKIGDSTKKVSYTIDPSDINSRSAVDDEYKDHGYMSHLTFEMPFSYENKHTATPSLINVKIYSEGGHRVVINEDEFGNDKDLKYFQIHLMNELIKIKKESDGV